MAGGLVSAAMASGFGQGLANASQTGLQLLGASLLQRERQAMEDRRMQLMEQAAAAREQRGYDFQRGLAQERIGAEMVMKGQEREARREELEGEREYKRGLIQEDRGQHIVEREQDRQFQAEQKGLDRAENRQDRTEQMAFNRDKLSSDERQHKESLDAQKQHYRAIEASAKRQFGDKMQEVWVNPKDQKAYALMEDGSSKPIRDEHGVHMTGAPKFSKQDEMLADGLKDEMAAMRRALEDPMTDPKRAAEIRAILPQKEAEYRRILGRDVPDQGPRQIVNPYGSPPASPKVSPPPPPVNRGEDYIKNKKAEVDQRKEDTRREAEAAMNAGTGLISSVDSEPTPSPSMPSLPPMERQRPTGMQQPGESVPTPPKPAPEAPPVIANVPRELPRASSAPLGRLGTEQVGMTDEGRPIINNPDGTVSTERTITEQVNGKWMNIPSMYGGKEVSPDQAVSIIEKNKGIDPETGRKLPTFRSMEEAVTAARERSKSLDRYGNSGGTDRYLEEKRNETAQREANIVQPSGKVVGSSIVGGATQKVEQETTEPKTTSRSGEQLLSTVPDDKRDYVRAQLQEAVNQLRSGRMTEKQFRASVLLAWASVPGNPDEWRHQANTLADGLISQVREGQ